MTLRLEVEAHGNLDLALDASPFSLWRHRGAVRLRVDDEAAARVRRLLALSGVRATPEGVRVPAPSALVRALGTSLVLARLQGDDLDLIEVTVVPLSDATARALRRPCRYWPLGARRPTRCRPLFGASEPLFEVRRTAW